MRLILTTIILTMLSQTALAKTTGELFKECKPWANNGYSGGGLTDTQFNGAMQCIAFQGGVIHLGFFACQDGDRTTRMIYGTSIIDTEVMTQRFLNWAEANPELWEYTTDPRAWIMGTCKE